jgi:hypothetical protein
MPSSVTHRRMARVFLRRADEASSRDRKLKYLRLAVSNNVRARTVEAEEKSASHETSVKHGSGH